ncbi:MAG: type VI secretion system-associated FHA domain protein TagH [Pseudomonadales bacterium]|nr:type VI secretion system-associated FHA domain protein TagH [Pseudomonadales bacterium]
MSLELIIIRQPRGALEVEARKTFESEGGTIGRADSNSWQLPDEDRYVSSFHAQIVCDDESYYLVDVSTNGVYINDAEEPLGEGNKSIIKHGDILVIGDYEIKVCLGVVPGIVDSPFAGMTAEMKALHREGIYLQGGASIEQLQQNNGVEKGEPVDSSVSPSKDEKPEFIKLKATQEQAVLAAEIADLEQQDCVNLRVEIDNSVAADVPLTLNESSAPLNLKEESVQEVIVAVKAETSVNVIDLEPPPESRKMTTEEDNLLQERDEDESEQSYRREQADEVARLLGIPSELIGEEKVAAVVQLMAVVLKESIRGQMTSLQVRHNLKGHFHAKSTNIQASENNPLKLSVSVEEALENILVRRGRGYLPPTKTIRQGFKDIDAHQKAMPIAMESAFSHLIRRFDPAGIQDTCDKNNTGIMNSSKKARYWDAFVDMYAEQVTDNSNCYQRLFMDDFSEAYEDAVARLMLN